jgi:hypothetical protein
MATKNVTLDDLVNSLDPQIKQLLYENTRKVLDSRPTILDITYAGLKINNAAYDDKEFKQIHDTLLTVVREKATRKFGSIAEIPRGYFDSSTPYLVYVDDGPDRQFLIAKSVGGIRSFVTDKISKDQRLVDTIFGLRKEETEILNRAGIPTGDVKTKYISNLDIGHIATEGELTGNLVSPLSYKLFGLIEYGEMGGDSRVLKYANEALNELYEIQADAEYSFKNTTSDAVSSASGLLGEAFVVVTLHTHDLNQQFSEQEKQIFLRLERQIALLATKALRDKFLDLQGSNTILQDIEQAVVQILKTGKSNLSGHTPHIKKLPKVKINKDKNVNTTGPIEGKSVDNTQGKKAPKPVSLVNLLTLLNTHIQDIVSANMGDGSSKRVLNYRTGRLAASVKVDRLSQSRDGMITAFYSYMRNPYGTFSDGGRQQFPRSRDPKLLISKSIKEIAETVVKNRMRAVLV